MTNQLEIRHFQYFKALAETLHFGKAAENLFISQSALSQQIQRLEQIVGKELFIRTNRSVSISQAGKLFLQESKIILNQIDISMERWQSKAEGSGGLIRIGFVGSAMQQFLPPIIKKFSTSYPDIEFHLNDLSNHEQITGVEQNSLDIGFIRAIDVPSSVHIKSVHKENLALVLPMDHAITSDNFHNIGQLSEESFILFPNERSHMYYQQIINLCHNHGFRPRISHRSIHGPTIFKLVESGLGVSIIPSSLKDENNYNVRFIELDKVPQKTELFMIWKKEFDNAAVPLFLEVV